MIQGRRSYEEIRASRRGRQHLLRGGKGRIVGFLGPNGAGKTTTMRVLTCFMPPTAGKANVAGFDVFEKPMEVKKRIGYLPETPPVYPEMEVADYLDVRRAAERIPSGDLKRRVDEVIERCAVARRAETS